MSTSEVRGHDPPLTDFPTDYAAPEATHDVAEEAWEDDRSGGSYSPACRVNVGMAERVVSVAAGAALAAFGLFHAQRGRLPLAAAGVVLAARGTTGHCSLYSRLGVSTAESDAGARAPREGRAGSSDATVVPAQHGEKVEKAVTINRSAAELYSFWREVENLPKVMNHLRRVDALDRQRSHWVADGALGRTVEWDAEIIGDRENEMIAWQSLPGSTIDTAGSVHFKELIHDRGTRVTVSLKYNPPAGKVGVWLASLTGDGLKKKLAEDLRNFQRLMEAGEIPRTA